MYPFPLSAHAVIRCKRFCFASNWKQSGSSPVALVEKSSAWCSIGDVKRFVFRIVLYPRLKEEICQPIVFRNVFIVLLSTYGGCSALLFYPMLMCSLWVMFKIRMLRFKCFINF